MTTPEDNTPDTQPSTKHVVFWLLIAGTIAVAVFTFVISFVGLRDYGMRLMGLDARLACLVPLGVDVFSLCGIAATYLLAHAPWHVRAYAWVVFLVPAGLSVAGNLAHASARSLPAAGMVGAAAAPMVLALAAHMVVVARRHLSRDSVLDSRSDTATVTLPAESAQASPAEPLTATDEYGQPFGQAPGQPQPDDKTLALRRLVDGLSCEEVAAEFGVTVRTVRRWQDDHTNAVRYRSRPRRNGQPTRPSADIATATVPAVTDAAPGALQTTSPNGAGT